MESTGAAEFDVGLDGTLVDVSASAVTTPAGSLCRSIGGNEERIKAEGPGVYLSRLSPDGTRVALDILMGKTISGSGLCRPAPDAVTRDPG